MEKALELPWLAIPEDFEGEVEIPVFFEVGTHYAGTTRAMGEALMEYGDPFHYITCDIRFWNTNPRGQKGFYPIDKFKEAKRGLEAHYQRVINMEMIEGVGADIVDQIPDPVVWCFLDGCHCRQCVEEELAAYGPRIAPGGFLLLHDCCEEYRGYPPDQPYHGDGLRPFEVIEVVDEWEPHHTEFDRITTTPPQPTRGKWYGGMCVFQRKLHDAPPCPTTTWTVPRAEEA